MPPAIPLPDVTIGCVLGERLRLPPAPAGTRLFFVAPSALRIPTRSLEGAEPSPSFVTGVRATLAAPDAYLIAGNTPGLTDFLYAHASARGPETPPVLICGPVPVAVANVAVRSLVLVHPYPPDERGQTTAILDVLVWLAQQHVIHHPQLRLAWGHEKLVPWIRHTLAPCALRREQHELLMLSALGYTQASIAKMKSLSERTIERQVERILEACAAARFEFIFSPFRDAVREAETPRHPPRPRAPASITPRHGSPYGYPTTDD